MKVPGGSTSYSCTATQWSAQAVTSIEWLLFWLLPWSVILHCLFACTTAFATRALLKIPPKPGSKSRGTRSYDNSRQLFAKDLVNSKIKCARRVNAPCILTCLRRNLVELLRVPRSPLPDLASGTSDVEDLRRCRVTPKTYESVSSEYFPS
ncbi:hypothetical protein IWZ01DRAFT_244925 [Phyllosticta capitalensis]